jgi:hypothetical protein
MLEEYGLSRDDLIESFRDLQLVWEKDSLLRGSTCLSWQLHP